MNETIETILNHSSVRQFQDIALTEQQVMDLVKAAQAASSASFQQAYSIIGINDKLIKEEIRKFSGNQQFIVKNGHFFVFCADLYRHKKMARKIGIDNSETISGIDAVILGAVEASLAAQNMAIASESMGLGICYVGGIRDGAVGVSACLGLPSHVIPIFGFAVGYPQNKNEKKPRLPFEIVYHENTYESDSNILNDQLTQYDKIMSDYYQRRSTNKRNTNWSEHTIRKSNRHSRLFMKDFINKKGFALH